MTRNERGQFVKGHPPTGGRKPREVEKSYLDVTMGAVSPADWREIIVTAVKQAKRGDAVARKFLADYLIGPPVQKQEHSGEVQIDLVTDTEHVISKLLPEPTGE